MAKLFRVSAYLVDANGELTKNDIERVLSEEMDANAQQIHIDESEEFEWDDELPENYPNCDMAHLERHFKEEPHESNGRVVKNGKIYRHFKEGKLVKVLAVCRDTEQINKISVVYEDLDNHKVWNRPYEMFLSEVDHEKYPDVLQKYRFEPCDRGIYPLARVLQDVVIEDKKLKMQLNEGEILAAIDHGDFWELRKSNGWGTMAPKDQCGIIYEILED